MKFHTNATPSDVLDAIAYARTRAREEGHGYVSSDWTTRGSRSHAYGHDVRLSGDGTVNKRRTNPGHAGGSRERAATWETWGWFMAYLFSVDPTTRTYADDDAEAFRIRTAGAFPLPELATTTAGR